MEASPVLLAEWPPKKDSQVCHPELGEWLFSTLRWRGVRGLRAYLTEGYLTDRGKRLDPAFGGTVLQVELTSWDARGNDALGVVFQVPRELLEQSTVNAAEVLAQAVVNHVRSFLRTNHWDEEIAG